MSDDQPEAMVASAPAPRPAPLWRAVAIALAGALVLVVGLVAAAPLWAPLLPWGAATDQGAERQLANRLDRLAATQNEVHQRVEQIDAAVGRLDHRVSGDEARPAAGGEIADLRQQITKLTASTGGLASRLDALDKAIEAHAAEVRAVDKTTDLGLALAVLPIRDAVASGQPFAEQYDRFAAVARNQPDIRKAAAPLAEPAKTGVATMMALTDGLRRLAADVAAKDAAPPAAAGWTGAIIARLASLVTIRRVDGAAAAARPAAAVDTARAALAGGDLTGAIAAIDTLSGPPATAAAPWLRSARQRLAADSAVQRIEALTSARLGGADSADGLAQ
jgi:hypothetical protein